MITITCHPECRFNVERVRSLCFPGSDVESSTISTSRCNRMRFAWPRIRFVYPAEALSKIITELVIASSNAGKLREISRILAPLNIEAKPQSAFAVSDAEEPHPTFIENALAKARHASASCGLPALADDSGICVKALDGAPGVHSARYADKAGEPRSDARNNQRLLEALYDIEDRAAHYVCVMVLVRHADDPQPIIAEAEWHGAIVREPRGANGFGYDPLFLIPELGKTAAEIPLEQKNAISHRGRALTLLADKLVRMG